ncbi:MAG: hypothetical protein ACRBFS_16900 [Aureispira sp.]
MTDIFVVGSLLLVGVLLILLGYWAYQKEKEAHRKIQTIIKDAELFQLINKTNHFITAKQLAEAVGLDLKRAKKHLAYLSQYGALKSFYNAGGTSTGVYQLVENVPLEAIPKMDLDQMSNEEVTQALLLYASDYQVTLAELVVIFDIDIYEAKALLNRLLKNKQVSYLFKGMHYIYVINPAAISTKKTATTPNKLKEELESLRGRTTPTHLPDLEGRIKIPDADVIQLAIEHDGRLTPTLLCLKSKISIEEAKYKLEQLYEQGTFVMDVDEVNYVMEYQLRDQSLLGK